MRPSPKNRRLIATAAATAAVCTAPACVSTPKPVPPLPAEPCPAGSQKTHERLGLTQYLSVHVWLENYVDDNGTYPAIRVKSGPTSAKAKIKPPPKVWIGHKLMEDYTKAIPKNTLFKGQLYVRENRVYGRFTEVTLPSEKPMPICMEVAEGWDSPGTDPVKGTRNKITSVPEIWPVDEFRPIPGR